MARQRRGGVEGFRKREEGPAGEALTVALPQGDNVSVGPEGVDGGGSHREVGGGLIRLLVDPVGALAAPGQVADGVDEADHEQHRGDDEELLLPALPAPLLPSDAIVHAGNRPGGSGVGEL